MQPKVMRNDKKEELPWEKVRIAMIGVGAISGIYLQNITKVFREVDLVGVCDLIPERAQKGAGYVEEQIKEGAAVPPAQNL